MERIDRITNYFIWLSSAHPIATLNLILAAAFVGGLVFCVGAMWLIYHFLYLLLNSPGATMSVMGAVCACGVAWCISEEKIN